MKLRKEINFFEGLQTYINRLILKDGDFKKLINMNNEPLGSLSGRLGYREITGSPVTTDGGVLGLHSYEYSGGAILLSSQNTNLGATSVIQWDNDGVFTNVQTGFLNDAKYDFCDFYDYCIGGGADVNNTYLTTFSINNTTYSTTDMVRNAPKGKFFNEFQGKVVISNCEVSDTRYASSAFISSGLMGRVIPITNIKGNQSGAQTTITVDSTKYLKAGDILDIYTGMTATRATGGDSMTIVAITNETQFTIASTTVTFADGDQVFSEDLKGTDKIYWDTDSPTPNQINITGKGQEITGTHSNKARIIFFKNNSATKWDGSKLSEVSGNIGCYSHRSVIEIDGITYWFYNKQTGMYRYDGYNEPELISDPVREYVEVMDDAWQDDVAVFVDKKGRIGWAIGEVTVRGRTYSNCEVVYNPKTQTWMVYNKGDRAVIYIYHTASGYQNNYYMGTNEGKIVREEAVDHDDNEPIAYEAESGWMGFDYAESMKRIDTLEVFSEHTGFSMSFSWDFGDKYYPLGDVNEQNAKFTLPARNNEGKLFSYKVYGSAQTPKPTIEKIVIKGEYLDETLEKPKV